MAKNLVINISIPDILLSAADKQAEVEMRNRSELFREALRVYLTGKGNTSDNNSFTNNENKRMREILNFSNYKEQKVFALSCIFRPQPNVVKNLFAGKDSPITNLIENPPHFRYAGWDLQTLDQAKPVAGEFLQVTNGDRKILRVYRDGQIVFAGDENFIGFGVNKENQVNFSVNVLAIAEIIANFVNFTQELSKHLADFPFSVSFKVQFFNPYREEVELIGVNRGNSFSDQIGSLQLDTSEREILVDFDNFKPEKVAYLILAEFFYFFGISEDRFWYVNKETKEINLDFFKDK